MPLPRFTGQMGATELLAGLLAFVGENYDRDGSGVGVGSIVAAHSGVSAEVHLPSGDRYVVVVQWIGDAEAPS